MSIFHTVQTYLDSNAFKGVVTQHQNLHALFTTYNNVFQYKRGLIRTGTPELTVEVRDHDEPIRTLAEFDARTIAVDPELSQQVNVAVSAMTAHETCGHREGASLFVVMYAGRNAMIANIRRTQQFREAHPGMRLVVVTCNCHFAEKEREFGGLMAEGIIDDVINGDCGGSLEMKLLLEAVICEWHRHRQTQPPFSCDQPRILA